MGLDVPAVSAVLTDGWGLADLRVEPNDAGMNSRTWLVEARTARYVAKLVPADQHDRFVSGLGLRSWSSRPAFRQAHQSRRWMDIPG